MGVAAVMSVSCPGRLPFQLGWAVHLVAIDHMVNDRLPRAADSKLPLGALITPLERL